MAVMKKYEQGALIKSLDHNLTQRNGVIFSKPEYSVVSQASVYDLKDFEMEQEIFEGLKLKLLIDTDSMGDSFSIKINDSNYPVSGKFEAGNIYNLVCVKSTNDLNEDVYSFEIEKSGGGAVFRTIIDQNVNIVPQSLTETGITITETEYSLINIVLYYDDFNENQTITMPIGVLTSKELINRPSFTDPNFAGKNAILCEPAERYSDMSVGVLIKDNKLFLYSQYSFNTINRIKISIM